MTSGLNQQTQGADLDVTSASRPESIATTAGHVADRVIVDNIAQTRSLTHRETAAGRRRGTVGGPANKLSQKLFLMSLSTVQ